MHFKQFDKYLIASFQGQISIFDLKGELLISYVNEMKVPTKATSAISLNENDNEKENNSEEPTTKKSKKEKKQHATKPSHLDSSHVIDFDALINDDDHLILAVIFNDKTAKIFKYDPESESKTIEKLDQYTVPKRPTAVKFDKFITTQKYENDYYLIIADKHGDVHRRSKAYNLPENKNNMKLQETPFLGHISMLLDVNVDEKYIYSAERDEKVRVTHRTRGYDIFGYLVGHEEYIKRIYLVPSSECSVTFSGDSSFKTWDHASLECLQEDDFGKETTDLKQLCPNSDWFYTVSITGECQLYTCFDADLIKERKYPTWNLSEKIPIYVPQPPGKKMEEVQLIDSEKIIKQMNCGNDFYKVYDTSGLCKNTDFFHQCPERYAKMYLDRNKSDA